MRREGTFPRNRDGKAARRFVIKSLEGTDERHEDATRRMGGGSYNRCLWPRPDVAHLVVDLSTTQFIDSSTIAVLITSKKRADASSRRFNLLLGTEPVVERILQVTGVLSLLNRVHALEEAIPDAPSPWPARESHDA